MVVIKVGTRLLTDTSKIPYLMEQINKLREKGFKVILVSSGAVGMGMKTIDLAKRPSQLSKKQALASVGQCKLMALYENAAEKYGFHVAQLLLTMSGLRNRERHLNTLNCINSLLDMGILPIINENDSVSVDELTFGDNDTLATLVAMMTKSKTTVILTTVDGVYNINEGKFTDRLSIVEGITKTVKALALGTDDSETSIGGMASKIKAAEMATKAGEYLWIANGTNPEILEQIFNAEDVGTLFIPVRSRQMPSKKRWLSFFTETKGKIFIDIGASNAIVNNGRSLLPSGITSVSGSFKRGSTVDLLNSNNKTIAKGLTNYSVKDLSKIAGFKSKDINKKLGYHGDEEVIHRDNLVII
ncbi:MAG TPA: glutamate 5-kinase [Victivallales bacterium]|nr:glutamate 5-kinase [Victivallales bacterium]